MNVLRAKLNELKNLFLSPQFGRFLLIGTINGCNAICVAYIVTHILPVNIAFIIGYMVSLTIAYFLNSHFVFKRRCNVERYLKFCLSYIPNFLIQNICVIIMFNWFGWHEIVSFALAAILGVPITYIMLNVLTFKNLKLKEKNNDNRN